MSNYHQITLSQASKYLYDYLQNNSLFTVATTKSLGGTIPLRIFTDALDHNNHGVAFWFCWKRNMSLTVPDYFMAFELNQFVETATPPISIRNNSLLRPANDCLFSYPGTTPPTLANTEAFLQTHDSLPSVVAATNISKVDTQALNSNYMTDFPDGNIHTEFDKVNCCFFSSKDIDTGNDDDGFLAFTQQDDIVYVRYYFCLVTDAEDVVHPKLILFGVGSDGKNLTSDTSVELEISWP